MIPKFPDIIAVYIEVDLNLSMNEQLLGIHALQRKPYCITNIRLIYFEKVSPQLKFKSLLNSNHTVKLHTQMFLPLYLDAVFELVQVTDFYVNGSIGNICIFIQKLNFV